MVVDAAGEAGAVVVGDTVVGATVVGATVVVVGTGAVGFLAARALVAFAGADVTFFVAVTFLLVGFVAADDTIGCSAQVLVSATTAATARMVLPCMDVA